MAFSACPSLPEGTHHTIVLPPAKKKTSQNARVFEGRVTLTSLGPFSLKYLSTDSQYPKIAHGNSALILFLRRGAEQPRGDYAENNAFGFPALYFPAQEP